MSNKSARNQVRLKSLDFDGAEGLVFRTVNNKGDIEECLCELQQWDGEEWVEVPLVSFYESNFAC
jgi:hypothetical protein